MSARSSSAKRAIVSGIRRQPAVGALDRDALDALAWIASGMPDSQVAYGPDAPELTEAQRQAFEPASYRRVSGR